MKKMIDYATSVLGILGATFIPVLISLYVITNLSFIKLQYIAMAGIGLTFWFFYDTMGNAAAIGVLNGFAGGISQIALVIVFLGGIAALAIFDQIAVPSAEVYAQGNVSGKYSKLIFLIPAGIAFVMGMHGFGEGWAFGSAGAAAQTNDILTAFGGGIAAIVSYLLHKFLETGIIAAAYTIFVSRNSSAVTANWHIPLLAVLFAGQSVLGAATGYYVAFDTTYFYAFGVTSAFYAVIRLAEAANPNFKIGENSPIRLGPLAFVALALGFILLYFAALFHAG